MAKKKAPQAKQVAETVTVVEGKIIGDERRPVGRPMLYRPEYVEQMLEYFKVEPMREVIMESSVEYYPNGEEKTRREKKEFVPNKLPTLFNFAMSIGVHYMTIWEWAHARDKETGELIHPDFSEAYQEAKELQKEFLIALGLSGAAPSAAFIFTAKNVTNMRDNSEITQNLNFSLSTLALQAAKRRKEREESERLQLES